MAYESELVVGEVLLQLPPPLQLHLDPLLLQVLLQSVVEVVVVGVVPSFELPSPSPVPARRKSRLAACSGSFVQ